MANDYLLLGQYDGYIENPIEFLDNLSEEGPIHRIQIYSKLPGWLVTGYNEAKQILNNPHFGKDNKRLQGILATHGCAFWDLTSTVRNVLNVDSIDHTRLRKLVIKPFTSRYLQNQKHWIRTQVKELLQGVPLGEEVDIVTAFAYPLPTSVIYRLLGATNKDDQIIFDDWTDNMLNPIGLEENLSNTINISHQIDKLIKSRQALRLTEDSPNLIDQLILANSDGDKLSNEELYTTIPLLLIAGTETTRSLITNLIMILGDNPELQAQIRSNRALIPSFIEEVLRNNSSLHTSFMRFVYDDIKIGDTVFKRDDIVLVSFIAANRDPKIYSDPKEIKLNRDNEPAHIGFGFGPHTCLGASLAKMEATLVLEELLDYCENITLAKPIKDIEWQVSNFLRLKTELPAILT